jgi:hypothetical protein
VSKFSNRLKRLETNCSVEELGGLPGKTVMLTGQTTDQILEAIEKATDAADGELLDVIDAHCGAVAEEAEGRPTREHYFLCWVIGLELGSWSLPLSIPRSVLEGFAERHGCIVWRCESCLTALGNGSRYSVCPVCGSADLSQRDFAHGSLVEYFPVRYGDDRRTGA